LLTPDGDVGALVKHLEYLVEHLDVWEAIGRAGREHVEQEYDVMVQVRK
jgi:glycosyltransferase involved in cell wall biosynthesis